MSSVLSIEFCTSWGYDLRAVALLQRFLKAYRHDGIESFNLIPSSGGVFEVRYNDKLIYSKKAQGIFPDTEDLLLVLDAEIRGY
jgi:selenoprotein W-related protein